MNGKIDLLISMKGATQHNIHNREASFKGATPVHKVSVISFLGLIDLEYQN